MSFYINYEIIRDGFVCSYGRFFAQPGRVERVEGDSLRSMFLPNLTPKGRKQLNAGSSDHFVRGQLKHYGVQFDECEFSGDGTLLLKKVLQAGKCDKVPDNIAGLREQMHVEWLNRLTSEELSSSPEWIIERYFLSSGQPDRTKTTAVVCIRLDRYSSYRASQMREAISKVAGLYHETGLGPKTEAIFMGWDSGAVSRAAKGHAAKEAKELHEGKLVGIERIEIYTDDQNNPKQKKGPKSLKTFSPVGSYIVTCKEIETNWDSTDNLRLYIRQTKEPGVFEASFDFGILEGIMIISAEQNTLEQYCSQLDREPESEWNEDSNEKEDKYKDDVENDMKPTEGSKRKAEAPRGRGRPPKKPKTGAAQPRTYLLRLKCRDVFGGDIFPNAEKGTIEFDDEKFASFIATAKIPIMSEEVSFTAWKASDVPKSFKNSWADYSLRRARRW